MKGILLVNHFYKSEGFSSVFKRLEEASLSLGIAVEQRTALDFFVPLGEPVKEDFDFVLFWDKDIALARRLEKAQIPVFNSAEAIALCDDKAASAMRFADWNLPMPQTLLSPFTYSNVGMTDLSFVEEAAKSLGLPFVIKETFGSFGAQVYLVHTVEEAKATVAAISPRPFLMQAFVASSFGKDIRVNVVGGRVVAAMERRGREGDFRSNIGAGGTGRAVSLSPSEEELALSAADAVGADFAGVDLLTGADGEPLLCEINSNPHFLGTEKYCGVDMAKEILSHVARKVKEGN